MDTFRAMQLEIERLQERMAALITQQREAALEQIKRMMQEYGIDASELGTVSSSRKPKVQRKLRQGKTARGTRKADTSVQKMREVRFRDPQTGATWSGRGRQPRWLEGKEREQFAVKH